MGHSFKVKMAYEQRVWSHAGMGSLLLAQVCSRRAGDAGQALSSLLTQTLENKGDFIAVTQQKACLTSFTTRK